MRDALYASLLVGLVCPLVGVFFVLRRMVFLGVALPQVSAAGIAVSFYAYGQIVGEHEHLKVSEQMVAMAGSFAFTLIAMIILAFFERRRETVEARIGVSYAIAASATMLFLAIDPHGEAQMVHLLRGDMLATTGTSLTWMAAILGGVVFVLFAFRRELLLVSFDRDLAVVFGKRPAKWDVVLYLLIGIVISLGVMRAGPLATFGFLVVPPVTMRMLAGRMLTFSLGSAGLGVSCAFAGFYCAYSLDLPLGPSGVAVASMVLIVVGTGIGIRRMVRGLRSR